MSSVLGQRKWREQELIEVVCVVLCFGMGMLLLN